jgi:hypothetical protein
MTNSEALPAPTLSELERALDEVVSAIVAFRLSPPDAVSRAHAGKDSSLKFLNASAMASTDFAVLRAIDLVAAPVEQGLKHSIRELGKLIHALVGDGGLQEVAERVSSLDDANYQRRISPIDSGWNGIGHWVS